VDKHSASTVDRWFGGCAALIHPTFGTSLNGVGPNPVDPAFEWSAFGANEFAPTFLAC